jgi:hypothetical protein
VRVAKDGFESPWIIDGLTPGDVASRTEQIKGVFDAHGVVIFRGLLREDAAFKGYLDDIRFMFDRIMQRHGERVSPGEDIGDILVRLKKIAPLDGQIVADMGTQHNKLINANRVKYADFVMALLEVVFGPDRVVATPQAGDTLHLFMPGEEFRRYALPIHQDYQYLMQSPRQATLYLGLSEPYEAAGGLEFWPGCQSTSPAASQTSTQTLGLWSAAIPAHRITFANSPSRSSPVQVVCASPSVK